MRAAVVGHIEWVSFGLVDRVPVAGQIVHATDSWELPAGGGAVAAVQLAKLSGGCDLLTAVGDDDLGERCTRELAALGVTVHPAVRRGPTRRAVALIDSGGERTITTLGERLEPRRNDALPWELLDGADAAYVTAGDPGAFEAARWARVLAVTSRALPALAASQVRADVVVGSARDPAERFETDTLSHLPELVVRTKGLAGGTWEGQGASGRWKGVVGFRDGEPILGGDAYGAGDSFAAALTFALAQGMSVTDAVALAARCGAACVNGRGPYEAQLTAADLAG